MRDAARLANSRFCPHFAAFDWTGAAVTTPPSDWFPALQTPMMRKGWRESDLPGYQGEGPAEPVTLCNACGAS